MSDSPPDAWIVLHGRQNLLGELTHWSGKIPTLRHHERIGVHRCAQLPGSIAPVELSLHPAFADGALPAALLDTGLHSPSRGTPRWQKQHVAAMQLVRPGAGSAFRSVSPTTKPFHPAEVLVTTGTVAAVSDPSGYHRELRRAL